MVSLGSLLTYLVLLGVGWVARGVLSSRETSSPCERKAYDAGFSAGYEQAEHDRLRT